ncbi:hypothetical protein D3C87_1821900 [compost metagenome]
MGACLDLGEVSSDVVARTASPTDDVDAVVVEENPGATGSFMYRVYLVPKGQGAAQGVEVGKFYGATRSESAFGVNAIWLDAGVLEIQYLDARTASIVAPKPVVAGRSFAVQERGGVADAAAPAGGMLYNLEG